MSRVALEDRILLVKAFYKNDGLITKIKAEWVKHHSASTFPTNKTINRIIEKFERTGSVADDTESMSTAVRTARTPEVVSAVESATQRDPSASVRRLAQEVGVSRETVRVIRRDDLQQFPYKIQLHQPLTAWDCERRLDFANAILPRLESRRQDRIRSEFIFFSDEAHFHLTGYVNKQNFRIWGSENPHFAVVSPLHPQKVTVWCALSAQGVIGPFFIEGTVNGEVYRKLLQEQFIPEPCIYH